jgi:hypothetical protein
MAFETYMAFSSKEEAAPLLEKLERQDVPFQLVDTSPSLDLTFGGAQGFRDNVVLNIQPEDFEKVDRMMQQEAAEIFKAMGKEHYLYEFSDEELIEVLKHYDQWSKLDFLLAAEVLTSRGIAYTQNDLQDFKNQRLRVLSRPDRLNQKQAIILFIYAFFGYFKVGWQLMYDTKQLPDGKRVYSYDKQARKLGRPIFYVGIIMAGLWVSLMLYIFYKTTIVA